MPDEIYQVRRVLAIMDCESRVDADLVGIFAKQPGADSMKSARPTERVSHDAGIGAESFASDPLDPFRHLERSASRERHQQDPARVSAADDEVGNTVSKCIRLAGPGAGNDEQRSSDVAVGANAVLDRSALLRIERFKIRCSR
jgi:hypothetical protein